MVLERGVSKTVEQMNRLLGVHALPISAAYINRLDSLLDLGDRYHLA